MYFLLPLVYMSSQLIAHNNITLTTLGKEYILGYSFAIFFMPPLLHLSWVKIFPSVLCFHMPSIYGFNNNSYKSNNNKLRSVFLRTLIVN
jgi:hypothetical protein